MLISLAVWLIFCFFIGGIPSGFLIGKLFGEKDLRRKGSHNIGATNAFRVLGAYPALLILICDVLKGCLPLIILKLQDSTPLFLACCGISAILGHDFSPYLKFRGGKGVATSLGVFMILSPKALFVSFLFWILLVLFLRIVSLASLCAGICLPIAIAFGDYPRITVFAGFTASLLLIFRHKENIRRLLKGEEKRLNFSKK